MVCGGLIVEAECHMAEYDLRISSSRASVSDIIERISESSV